MGSNPTLTAKLLKNKVVTLAACSLYLRIFLIYLIGGEGALPHPHCLIKSRTYVSHRTTDESIYSLSAFPPIDS